MKALVDIAISTFGYQNQDSIDRRFGLIRKWQATHAAAYEGTRLRERLLDRSNTDSHVWADTAYRSKAYEALIEANGFVSRVHRKKPKGKLMPEAVPQANSKTSKVGSQVELVFALHEDRMDLFIRPISIARATMKIGMANLVYNIKRLLFLERTPVAKGSIGRKTHSASDQPRCQPSTKAEDQARLIGTQPKTP